MDFNTLLYHAQMNTVKKHDKVKYCKASLNPLNKEENKVCLLSDRIKKCFAKKKENKQKEKYRLLMLKSQEKKSFESVQSMLNDTKNSVIEDKKDELITLVKMAGDNQPDKDNNKYISKYGMDICSKVVDNYKNITHGSANHRNLVKFDIKNKSKVSLLKKENKQLFPLKQKGKPKAVENSCDHNNKDFVTQKKISVAKINSHEPKDSEKGALSKGENKQILLQKRKIKPKAVESSNYHYCMDVEPLRKKSKTDVITDKPKDKEKGVLPNGENRQILPPKRKIKSKAVENDDNHNYVDVEPLQKKFKSDVITSKPKNKEKGALLKGENKQSLPLKQEAKLKVVEDSNDFYNKDIEIQKKNSIAKINTNEPEDREKAALSKGENKQVLPQKRKIKPEAVESSDYHYYMDVKPLKKKSKTDVFTDKPKKQSAQLTPLSDQKSLEIFEKKRNTSIVIEKSKLNKPLSLMDQYEREIFLKEQKIEELIIARLQRLQSTSKCNISIYSPKEGNECLLKSQTTPILEKYESSKISAFEKYVPKGNSSLSTVEYTPNPIVCSEENYKSEHLSEIVRMQEDFDECMFRSNFLTLLNEKCSNAIADVEEEMADIKREIEMIKNKKSLKCILSTQNSILY